MAGVLALTPAHNTRGKHDATRAFIPEARRFLAYWADQGFDTYEAQIDNRAANRTRRRQTAEAISEVPHLKHLAIFAHGWRTGIQFGFRMSTVRALARRIDAAAMDEAPIITLYCCSTAQGDTGGDGGFADELRDALCRLGLVHCRVDAHVTKGHTTRNPFLRRFDGEGSYTGGQGGRYLVRPRSKLWRAWKQALRDRDDELRYRVSQMDVADVHGWLLPTV